MRAEAEEYSARPVSRKGSMNTERNLDRMEYNFIPRPTHQHKQNSTINLQTKITCMLSCLNRDVGLLSLSLSFKV